MQTDYNYTLTPDIQQNLIRIESAKRVIDFLPQLPHVEASPRRRSLLKSSLFSAKIEGNTLELDDVEAISRSRIREREKLEVFNILRALNWLSTEAHKKLIKSMLLTLHRMVMEGLSAEAGRFRTEPSAIFNQAGVVIYMPPPPSEIPALIDRLLTIKKKQTEHPVIYAAKAHMLFEKIHPFLDGNGRVGRLVSAFLFQKAGYDFRGIVAFEEYLSDHRQAYYDALNVEGRDITDFVSFFTEAVATSAEKVISLLQDIKEEKPEDSLLPKRQEILAIIREQKLVSFDFLRRKFQKIPQSSLHYDLKMLLQKGFIKKLGSTRGVLYRSS